MYTNADWNAVLCDGERKEMGIQMSITKRTHSWGKMYLFILFILGYDTNQEEGIFMPFACIMKHTHVYDVGVCVWWKLSCVFLLLVFFLSFLDYTEILETFLDKNISMGIFGHYGVYNFLYMYAFPSRFIYTLAFSSDLLKTSFVEMHTCFFWTDVQVHTSPFACVSVTLSHARNLHSVPDFSDCKREYFTLPSCKTQNVYRCMCSLSNTVVMFCQM